MRLAVPMFAAVKKAFDNANLTSKVPGGYVVGERIKNPGTLPALMPWPTGEAGGIKTNKGQINDLEFEMALLAATFEGSGDVVIWKAIEDALATIAPSGPVALGATGVKLVAIMPVADSARYAEFPPDLFVCFVTFSAKLSF